MFWKKLAAVLWILAFLASLLGWILTMTPTMDDPAVFIKIYPRWVVAWATWLATGIWMNRKGFFRTLQNVSK